jgi:hypothetical protein
MPPSTQIRQKLPLVVLRWLILFIFVLPGLVRVIRGNRQSMRLSQEWPGPTGSYGESSAQTDGPPADALSTNVFEAGSEPTTAQPDPATFAAKATDLQALRDDVVDAASVGTGLWLSYLFVLFYFAIAAGAVTHRDLLLKNPVKLPFLNVELPLEAFFVLGPLIFLIVHSYVLLHFVLLAGKIGAFQTELENQIGHADIKAQLRRQLPSNIFVQSLAGPRDVSEGTIGFLLRLIIRISLVVGPIALLILFQLQFLPYHSEGITNWQRVAVVIDLGLLWLLWPPIARSSTNLLGFSDF